MGNKPSTTDATDTTDTTDTKNEKPKYNPTLAQPINLKNRQSLSPIPFAFFFDDKSLSYPNLITQSKQRPLNIFCSGSGDTGKTTIIRQIVHQTSKKVSTYDLEAATGRIHNNIIVGLRSLCDNSSQYGPVQPHNQQIFDQIQSIAEVDSSVVEKQYLTEYQSLWNDPVIQQAWENRSKCRDDIMCIDWWMDKLDIVLSPNWIPTEEDAVRYRVRTTGLIEYPMRSPQGIEIVLWDTGGQRNERKKWHHLFEQKNDIHIAFASLSSYNQYMFEDDSRNRLVDSINTFGEIVNNGHFNDTRHILVLTKYDLFLKQIQNDGFKGKDWSAYTNDSNDEKEALAFIIEQFRERMSNGHKLDVLIVNALESDHVAHIIYKIGDIIDESTDEI